MTGLRRGLVVVGVWVLLVAALSGAVGAPETTAIGPGVTHTRLYRPEGPWAINVVEADLSQELLCVKSRLGMGEPAEGWAMMGRRTVGEIMSGQVAAAEGGEAAAGASERPVAGVNADFFALAGEYYATTPLGLQIEGGELVTFPDPVRSVLFLLADGRAHIGRFQVTAWLRGPGELLYRVAGMNRSPGYADLVVFSPRFGEQTWAEEGTTQFAVVGLSGPLRPNAEVRGRIASIAVTESQRIPPEGVVLAARGVAAYALRGLEVGDEVRLSLKMEPLVVRSEDSLLRRVAEAGEIVEAVGGGPRLVREGVISVEHLRERFLESFAQRRHPRTGVGIRDGTLVMVTVDGRQPGYSEGMTLPEFAELFLELGCREAMNLDGGGSTTMVVRDRVVNSPSGGTPRAVINALCLFSTAPVGPPEHLAIEPAEVCVLSGDRAALEVRGLDEHHGLVPLGEGEVKWECAGMLGSVDEEGVFEAAEVSSEVVGLVAARCGELTASSVVRVLPGPARVVVAPGEVRLGPGEVQQFLVQGYDAGGRPVSLAPGAVVWSCEPAEAGGAIDESGLLWAPAKACRLTVAAHVGEVIGEAAVVVGAPLRVGVMEDFEERGEWSYRGRPSGVPGSVEWGEDPLAPGNHCLWLKYDFSTMEGTRTAHAEVEVRLPETGRVSLRVMGDGAGTWLRARLRDGAGRVFTVDLADRVNWSGEWRSVGAVVPEGIMAPVTLESVYVAEYRADRKPVGQICLDDIGATQEAEAN